MGRGQPCGEAARGQPSARRGERPGTGPSLTAHRGNSSALIMTLAFQSPKLRK